MYKFIDNSPFYHYVNYTAIFLTFLAKKHIIIDRICLLGDFMLYQFQHFGISEYFCKEYGENFNYPIHLHQSFEFIVVLDGEMKITVDSKTTIWGRTFFGKTTIWGRTFFGSIFLYVCLRLILP